MQGLYVVWSSTNEIGVPIVDEQHRGIASIINTLFDFMPHHDDVQVLYPLLVMIELYVRVHFLTEERLFERTHYDGAEKHKHSHAEFMRELHHLIVETKFSGDPAKLLSFLKKLWFVHINDEDKRFGVHVRKYLEAHPLE